MKNKNIVKNIENKDYFARRQLSVISIQNSPVNYSMNLSKRIESQIRDAQSRDSISNEDRELREDPHLLNKKESIPEKIFGYIKRFWRDYVFLLLLAGVVIGLDQWIKALVRENVPKNGYWMPWDWLSPYVRILNINNTGTLFGLFQEAGLFFTILAIIVTALIIFYFPRAPRYDWSLRVAMGLQLGGAIGNLIDRLVFGKVTDFISIGTFPVFNVADSSITLGVVVLILGMWIKERAERIDKAGETNE